MIRTLVFGDGRMAQCLLDVAFEYPDIEIVAQVSRTSREERAGPPFFPSFEAAREQVGDGLDLVIDFTMPQGTLAAAHWCGEQRVALLSGVTGIGEKAHTALDKAADSAPVLWAANLSFGINLMAGLLRDLGRVIDRDTAVTIVEVHQAGKQDAPSGTALFLARHLSPPADGAAGTDPGRTAEDFPGMAFVSSRQGDVVGDHSVSLRMRDEVLTLSHHAADRRLFARGALEAAQWLAGQPPGRYSAADWIRSVAARKFK
jgi:4-hydroxy-tetrahydrodipicolinate reductase